MVNALQTTDASAQTIADAKTYNRKIQGKKASSTQPQTDPNTPAPNTISSSQQSYDQLIQHLSGLTSILAAELSYTPNEADLQITNLETIIANLSSKNNAVAAAYAGISNARIARNETLYTKEDSLFETASEVKKYIKSVFGATSPQFAQVKGLEFKKPKL